MANRPNPLKLNALQLKTLTVLQQLARTPLFSREDEESGGVQVHAFPRPHGDHFHVGDAVVMAKDMTGLQNKAVWNALERKGLARSQYPGAIILKPEALEYDTGLADKILFRSDH